MTGVKFDKAVYKSWEKRYFRDPERTLAQLKRMKGYHKRYLLIMRESSSKRFKKEIMKIIIDKLNRDLYNLNNKKRMTTLAKWLPREGKSFDRDLDFVNQITKMMYPGLKPQEAKNLYRKNIVKLTAKLDIVETKLSNKDKNIDFKKLPTLALRKYVRAFSKDSELLQKYESEVRDRMYRMRVDKFIDELMTDDNNRFEESIIRSAFLLKREMYAKNHCYIDKGYIPVIDMSTTAMIRSDFKRNVLATLFCLEKTDSVVIAGDVPVLIKFEWNVGIRQKCHTLFKNRQECDIIDLAGVIDDIGSKEKFLVLSKKDVVNDAGKAVSTDKKRIKKVNHGTGWYVQVLILATLAAFIAYIVVKN